MNIWKGAVAGRPLAELKLASASEKPSLNIADIRILTTICWENC